MNNNTAFRVIESPQFGYLYLLNAVGTDNFKIGKSRVSVVSRINQLQTGCPIQIRYVYHAYVEDMSRSERDLHLFFKQSRNIGEWFTLKPADVKECITLMRLVQVEETAFLLPQQKDEELDKLPEFIESVIEQIYFTDLGITREAAVELISKLKYEKHNQTEIVWMLWNARPGKTKTYELALAEYKELTKEKENEQ